MEEKRIVYHFYDAVYVAKVFDVFENIMQTYFCLCATIFWTVAVWWMNETICNWIFMGIVWRDTIWSGIDFLVMEISCFFN